MVEIVGKLKRGATYLVPSKELAGTTGLEPAASAVTGQRSNQLNYVPLLNRLHFQFTISRDLRTLTGL